MGLKNFTILYVEDSKLLRKHMTNLLQNHVKSIYTANDGKEGLEQFVKIKPDIVITDINMPNIDGMQMSKMIKSSFKDIPIILLTEFDKVENLKKAIMLGVDLFIAKPINDQEIIAMLEKIAQKLQNKIDSQTLKVLQQKQDKAYSLLKLLKEIGYHWRQPLNEIMTVATEYEFKKMNNIYTSEEEEFYDIAKIPDQIEKLSNMLKVIQDINFNEISLDELNIIIQKEK